MTFDELVTVAGEQRASDIHLRAGHAPLNSNQVVGVIKAHTQ